MSSPAIFHDGRQLALWSDRSGIADISTELGKKVEDVYPIYWKSAVPVNGYARTGRITLSK